MSRRFVAMTQARLDEVRQADLSGFDLAVLMVDGLHIDKHVVLVALGIDSEDASVCSASTRVPPRTPAPVPQKIAVVIVEQDPNLLARLTFGIVIAQAREEPREFLDAIEEPDMAKKILVHLGLPVEPLPTARAKAPPVTLELFPAA